MIVNTLAHHLACLPPDWIISITGNTDHPITAAVTEDSRSVQPGGIFVARQGLTVDGHDYIPQAIENGAMAVIVERPVTDLPEHVTCVQVQQAQIVTGWLAASYHDFPSRKLTVIGITGTNGKTTTTHLLHSILSHATGKVGFISTIAADTGNRTDDTGLHVTTPTAPRIQHYLAEMVDAGLRYAVLEMTSHGLAQDRLAGVDLDMAILTNLTHEHLDYHGSWQAYRDAKARMFHMLSESYRKPDQQKISILNRDDPSFEFFAAIPADDIISYGIQQQATLQSVDIIYDPDRTRITLSDQTYPQIETYLTGAFNVYNVLAATAAARALNILDVQPGILAVQGISGRMERISEGQDFIAMVDFAHTPDALQQVLDACQLMRAPGKRIIAVFGSAGLRDVEKRRMMAEISARSADMTVLTAEDPRTESLDDILEMMAAGCRSQGGVEDETFIRVPDRGRAIYHACQIANPGDFVVVCGKGHEQSMCFGTVEHPWDDRDALRSALQGEPLLTLPTAQQTSSTQDSGT